jgi:hypothetical protein
MTPTASSPTTPTPRRELRDVPHPGYPHTRCTCDEGRIISGDSITWLPPVHDCLYIQERNRKLFGHEQEPTR